MSDVFVVPNLNAIYREVYVVNWKNETCEVEKADDGTLPITTIINLEDVKNQPALAFYSRYHVEYVKLPELRRSAGNIQNTMNECDCANNPENMCFLNGGEKKRCDELGEQINYLRNATNEWNENLTPKDDLHNQSIVNWFEEVGSQLMTDENDLNINGHSSALAPQALVS
eukprot:2455917-Ditylum_brightwellii.AAC.1